MGTSQCNPTAYQELEPLKLRFTDDLVISLVGWLDTLMSSLVYKTLVRCLVIKFICLKFVH
jgi:hypothetical protein